MHIQESGSEVVITLSEMSLFWGDSRRTREELLPPPPDWAGKTVRVDLAGVGPMSADGVCILLCLMSLLRQQGGKLILCNPNDDVSGVLRVTTADRFLEIVRDGADPCVIVESRHQCRP